ncbi:hypothetical protein [Blastococcus sp. PRF04-17]|uniref:hypothetical protein n=1 Tax=Blastococcus sp. PRF04-17 TaxID=2933797 RepID=UPI001FF649FC|nr:hypothetical protein [Blastococcus sp. PRF04-17]UOY02359.1 hypothetical protein MVA48_02950 [Blastococcus sp. PRF04-17]
MVAARKYSWPAVRMCRAPGVFGLTDELVGEAARAWRRTGVPASSTAAAASGRRRHARSTSSISPPEFSIATTLRSYE